MPYISEEPMRSLGLSLPVRLVTEVDKIRGDVNRSRYVQRLIEKYAIQTGSKVLATEDQPVPVAKRSKS
jgi:metal-responsive CopG/Arc/MetJ family transcriptional regulator